MTGPAHGLSEAELEALAKITPADITAVAATDRRCGARGSTRYWTRRPWMILASARREPACTAWLWHVPPATFWAVLREGKRT